MDCVVCDDIVSVGSLVVHLSMTKSSHVQLASYARDTLWKDFDSLLGAQVKKSNLDSGGFDLKNVVCHFDVCRILEISTCGDLSNRWRLCSLYANPRNSYPATSSRVSSIVMMKSSL